MPLAEVCKNIPEPIQTMGRPRLPLCDMIFAATFKIFSTVSGRRFISDLNDAQAKGYLSKTPHFNSIFYYLELESLTPLLRELITKSALPLKAIESDFAVDSSGFGSSQFATWYNEKYGTQRTGHDWVEAHLMCGTKTNVVTSVEISVSYEPDTKFLPALVTETAKHFDVKKVSADKAYSSRSNYEAVASIGATPYLAFKSNASTNQDGVFEKMYYFFCYNRDTFLAVYHKRSNVESTFSMIKAKFGGNVRSKTRTAQINEVLCKIIVHYLCCLIQSVFEFGLEIPFCAENAAAQEVG